MNLNKSNIRSIIIILFSTILFYVCLQNLNTVFHCLDYVLGLLSPFILGGCIAFVMNMPMKQFEQRLFSRVKNKRIKKIARPISILLTIVFILGIIFIVLFLMIPELVTTFSNLIDSIPAFSKQAEEWINDFSNQNPQLQEWIKQIEFDWSKLSQNLISFLQASFAGLFSSTVDIVGSVVSGLLTFVIGFVFAIYILFRKEALATQGKKIIFSYIPLERGKKIISILQLTNTTFSNFLSGQCTEAIILGLMFFISMSIFHFPYALLIGVFISFTSLIPIFGAFIACFVALFLILMVNPIQCIYFVILFLILQQIEENLIYPHVVGSSVGLPSIWVLVAVTLGGSLMGIIGMLIFIPISSVLYSLIRGQVNKRIKQRNIPKDLLN